MRKLKQKHPLLRTLTNRTRSSVSILEISNLNSLCKSCIELNSIDLRRIWIADEERGLVFGLTMFRHPMEQKTITILKPDGTTSERPMNFNPFDLEAAHIFKIWDGKIHEIEAMGFSLPLYSKNGWNPFVK